MPGNEVARRDATFPHFLWKTLWSNAGAPRPQRPDRNWRKRARSGALGLALFTASAAALALDPSCPDAQLFSGRLMTDICWSCLFPIRVLGASLGGGGLPDGASRKTFCSCKDSHGLPHPGMATGMWQPARLVELVRSPTCAPALGGIRLPIGSRRLMGTFGEGEYDNGETGFYNYHYYAFPLLVLLDLFTKDRCNPDGYVDFDALYLSEVDPTWNNEELAFFTNPEAAFTAGPAASAACIADGIQASNGQSSDATWWCAGSWGRLYPLSGVYGTYGSPPRHASLLATRVLAALHRRGLAKQTMGDRALCKAPAATMLPKSQYKMTQFYPFPETARAHRIGQNVFTWGESRWTPGPGEDQLYLIWRWNDCCNTF